MCRSERRRRRMLTEVVGLGAAGQLVSPSRSGLGRELLFGRGPDDADLGCDRRSFPSTRVVAGGNGVCRCGDLESESGRLLRLGQRSRLLAARRRRVCRKRCRWDAVHSQRWPRVATIQRRGRSLTAARELMGAASDERTRRRCAQPRSQSTDIERVRGSAGTAIDVVPGSTRTQCSADGRKLR